jgi:hypothetical protein
MRMRRVSLVSMLFLASSASIPAHGQESVAVAIGKRFAVDSGIEWKSSEINHPVLGPIQFAGRKTEVVTAVRDQKIFSNTYVSCQRKTGTIALELTNAPSTAPERGLGPIDLPRLVCNSPGPGGSGVVKTDLAASWEIGTLGDTLARGLSPSTLRQCVSIDVLQNLALPTAWRQESQRVGLQITPYAKELDAVFSRCGEATAYGIADPQPAAAPATRATPAPTPGDRTARASEPPWMPARTIAKGHSNVRAAANVTSRVVIQLDPGARIQVQKGPADWWKVKPGAGAGNFSGYIRDDRVELERPGR